MVLVIGALSALAALHLWDAPSRHPYDFYIQLRWLTCAALAGCFWQFRVQGKSTETWLWVLGGAAVLYNPLIPVHLDKGTWTLINMATLVLLAAANAKLWRGNNLVRTCLPDWFSEVYYEADRNTSNKE